MHRKFLKSCLNFHILPPYKNVTSAAKCLHGKVRKLDDYDDAAIIDNLEAYLAEHLGCQFGKEIHLGIAR